MGTSLTFKEHSSETKYLGIFTYPIAFQKWGIPNIITAESLTTQTRDGEDSSGRSASKLQIFFGRYICTLLQKLVCFINVNNCAWKDFYYVDQLKQVERNFTRSV